MPIGAKRIGEMLVEKGLITEEQLQIALERQKKTKERIGHILVKLGYVTEDMILDFLSTQLGVERIKLDTIAIEELIEKGIKQGIAKNILEVLISKHLAVPIALKDSVLTIAMVDPLDIFAIDDIARVTGYKIKPTIASENEIKEIISKYYKEYTKEEEVYIEDVVIDTYLKDLEMRRRRRKEEEEEEEEERIDIEKMKTASESAPVVKLVNYLFGEALKMRASDIHIEPFEKFFKIRYRIDGVLHDKSRFPKAAHAAVVSRIKILSNLDIAEKRLPQDGRSKIRIGNREADLRISIVPTSFGEKVVIRILDPKSLCLDLTKLGFEEEALKIYKEKITTPYGIILITGPTGSGKTTTLYSTLATLNSPDKNIMTVEDPVEYILEGVNQMQVKPEIGLDFAAGLRAYLRQDPDIILVGEIRDRETAEVAINAALTGHLVFSTLHTNDAPSAITRLLHMGIEPFLISSTLIMAVAQRLVRVICDSCRTSYKASPALCKELGLQNNEVYLYKGKGCAYCAGTGYHGRIGIFEVMVVNEQIKNLILEREAAHRIKEAAIQDGMEPLRVVALKKVLRGITTVEEMYRVTFEG